MSEDKESTTQATTTSSSETDTSKPSKFKTQDEAEKYLWDKLPEYANDQSSYAHWTFWGNGWWNDSLYHKDDPMLKDALKKIHDEQWPSRSEREARARAAFAQYIFSAMSGNSN